MADERDPKVSSGYREMGAEEPPRALDQAILAAARRAADEDARRSHAPLVTPAGRHRWYFSLGAAAVIVLAVAVTVHIERRQPQQPDPEAVSAPASSAAKEAPPEAAPQPQPKPSVRPKAEPPRVFAPDPAPRASVEERAPAAPPSVATPSSPSAGAAADSASPRRRESAEMQSAPRATARTEESLERWLERIVRLRKDGEHEEADKALAEFRKRYPDYRIPDAMLEKVEKK